MMFVYRSLPKLSTQDEDGCGPGAGLGTGLTHGHPQHCSGSATFEPIPHDHDFCERVTINVSRTFFTRHIMISARLNAGVASAANRIEKYIYF